MVCSLKKLTFNELCQKAEDLATSKEMLIVRLNIILLWYRDLLLWQLTGNQELLLNQDHLSLITEEALFYPFNRLLNIISKIEQTQRYLNTNVNVRLAVEVLLLNIQQGRYNC